MTKELDNGRGVVYNYWTTGRMVRNEHSLFNMKMLLIGVWRRVIKILKETWINFNCIELGGFDIFYLVN